MKHIIKTVLLCVMSVFFAACNSSTVEMQEFYGPRPPKADSNAGSNRVIEYMPAPGQFINNTLSGFAGEDTQEKALAYADRMLHSADYTKKGLVSLGGFGGYIVVGFDHSIQVSASAGGYDFSITGNSFPGSSEPGIVWVMPDENGNGIPDDGVWYELMGAYYNESDRGYEVTYHRETDELVSWSDNKGKKGAITRNSTHKHDYFPAWINGDYTLSGTLLPDKSGTLESGRFTTGDYAWGYADNWSEKDMIEKPKPSAPYSKNFFRIADAVNSQGTPARLKYIDFIKVQTGVNVQGGAGVGELSTEVMAVTDENLK